MSSLTIFFNILHRIRLTPTLLIILLISLLVFSLDESVCSPAQQEGMNDYDVASGSYLLGGAEEPCDGYDNDSDGTIDEGCDGICDNPEKGGSDIRITYDSAYSMIPDLAWTGSKYGITWYDNRDGNDEIYFIRTDSAGNPIGSETRLTSATEDSSYPSLAWNGSEYGLSWSDRRDSAGGSFEIYFMRLDAEGNKIGSDIRVTFNPFVSVESSLAWSGSEYGIIWLDARNVANEIYFARLDDTGTKIGSDVRVTNDSSMKRNACLVWNGSGYGVTWDDERDGNVEIYFARLSSTGSKIGSDVRVTADDVYSQYPSITWTGNEYGISWHDDRDGNFEIYLARLNSSGSKIGFDIRITEDSFNSFGPDLTWTGEEYGITWKDARDGNFEIYAARLNSTGSKIGTDMRLTNKDYESEYPIIAWSGQEYGIVWRDYGDLNYELYFNRIRCCDDLDGDGYTECAGDSNDQDPLINPDAVEICDGDDNDSDGTVDEGCDSICDSPEKWGDDQRLTNNSFSSARPDVAWTGADYGISWEDDQSGNKEIFFARLDSSGNQIGSDLRVTNDAADSIKPSLVWTGEEYGIAWEEGRDGNWEVYFARIDASGAKIGSDVRITGDSSYSFSPSLAWSGSEYAVAWQEGRDGGDEIYFVRIDASGNKIGSDVRLTYDFNWSGELYLIWADGEYAVTWADLRDGPTEEIYFAHMDGYGNKIGSDIRVTYNTSISGRPSLTWTGSEYGISWIDAQDGNQEIYFARLDSSGSMIGSDVRVTFNQEYSSNPGVLWTGSEYGFFFNDHRDGNWEVYFSRLDASGNKIGNDLRITKDPALSGRGTIAWSGNEYSFVWRDERDGNDEIYFARARCCDDADGDGYSECSSGESNDADASINRVADEICDGKDNNSNDNLDEGCDGLCDNEEKGGSDLRLTEDPSESSWPSLIWTGTEYAVSWYDNREANYEIYFTRLDSSGSQIGSEIRVTEDPSDSYHPSLIWNGTDYGVSWRDTRDGNNEIYFARLDNSGNKIGGDVRVSYDSYSSDFPSLVWAESEFGIAWEDTRNGGTEVYVARLDANGNKLGSDIRATNASGYSSRPSLAWAGEEYGLSWYDNRDGNYEIYFARLDASGNKIGSDVRMSSDSSNSYRPSLIWTGNIFGMSWDDNRDGNYEIYFARLDSLGSKIGSDMRVTSESLNSLNSSLEWSGSEYTVAWRDQRDGNYEIYHARLDASGNKVGSDLRVTSDDAASYSPSLAWTGTEYGISWYDNRDGNSEIYFSRIQCCDDVDGDTYTEEPCSGGDCNDNDDTVYPGATELCDHQDNDCDGTTDEGFLTPGETSGLVFDTDKQTMSWNVESLADRYDVVKGDLPSLRTSGGDFNASLTGCLENDSAEAKSKDSLEPSLPGEGFYYLVRAQRDCKSGTYDTGLPSQVGDRDAEIESSANNCP